MGLLFFQHKVCLEKCDILYEYFKNFYLFPGFFTPRRQHSHLFPPTFLLRPVLLFMIIYMYTLLVWVSVCLYVSNKCQNGWTHRAQIFFGTSRDPREGLWMIEFSKILFVFVLQCLQSGYKEKMFTIKIIDVGASSLVYINSTAFNLSLVLPVRSISFPFFSRLIIHFSLSSLLIL